MLKQSNIVFSLSGVEHTVSAADVHPEITLNAYVRETLHLTGTKRMCLEGGCGACIVAVEENVDGKRHVFAINSCLVSILSCHGWKIHTIEGIGNPLQDYHPIQKLLADNNGTQCGFCSPGMVMNMYALHESGPKTMKDIENSFAGNICRCTGYRPILTAFKKLATDAGKVNDIEDIKPCRTEECREKCNDACDKNVGKLLYQLGDSKWVKVYTMNDLLEILKISTTTNYMLVAGNTARGVYKNEKLPDTYIDVTSVYALTGYTVNENTLVLGANLTLTRTMEIFSTTAKQHKQFSYLSTLVDHIDLVATLPVRNIGTIAGNLMIKYKHNEFASDIFLLLETFNAKLVIVDVDGNEVFVTPKDFLRINMTKKVIKSVILSSLDHSYIYSTYKIMPRAQNAHAMVNAGFLMQTDGSYTIRSARVVYGGINPQFIHATNTENLLKGRKWFDNGVLQKAFKSLDNEIVPDYVLPDPSPEYRKNLAIALFYKFTLKSAPQSLLSTRVKSGGTLLERPVSSGFQEFHTQKQNWPLSQPVIKLEALAQTSGQAEYIDDIPDLPNQLFAAYVTAKTMANSTIVSVDASVALKMKGVVAYYDKKDIPGENTFTPKMGMFNPLQEELFCSGRVLYFHQPIGIVVAKSHDLAQKAADLVKVTYSPPKTKPSLSMKALVKANIKEKILPQTNVPSKGRGTDVKHVVKGSFYIGQQYHYHMELQCCNVVPTEDGLVMHPSTQWMDLSQIAASKALNIPMNKIDVKVRRLGGGFGAKLNRNGLISTPAALAAVKLRKPVKMWLPLETNMNVIGKRYPLLHTYEVGVNDKGVIQYLDAKLYSEYGVGGNDLVNFVLVPSYGSCYDTTNWNYTTYKVVTDTYANTSTRAPGSAEGIAASDCLMEHIAYTLNLDPIDVKMANLNPKHTRLNDFRKDMETWGNIAAKKEEIKVFNAANRWKKKGLALVPMTWTLAVVGNFTVLVSIYHGDGAVVISHGGIEMGQGINTKVAQVCAYKFGITLDKVAIKPSYNVIAPNGMCTGGSLASEDVCFGVIQACDALLARIKPVRDKMNNPKWEDLINQCFADNVHLSASGFFDGKGPGIQEYPIFGYCAAEVEIDILTGQCQITSVDIIEDVGDSMSPLVDIGQIEGAFVMGIGYHASEEIIFNENGELLTNRTWNYKPPGAKDIPVNFRIKFPGNIPNPVGVLHSKATGEPSVCLAVAIPLAIRHALDSAIQDADSSQLKWIPIDGPTTVEKTFLYALNNHEQYVL